MEQCGQCGAPLEPGDRFCGDCGAPLAGCPACGAPVVAGKRFCKSCGHALTGAAPAPRSGSDPGPAGPGSPATTDDQEPVAERRVCSVLFCDFVGFTPLAEARDPEAVRELL